MLLVLLTAACIFRSNAFTVKENCPSQPQGLVYHECVFQMVPYSVWCNVSLRPFCDSDPFASKLVVEEANAVPQSQGRTRCENCIWNGENLVSFSSTMGSDKDGGEVYDHRIIDISWSLWGEFFHDQEDQYVIELNPRYSISFDYVVSRPVFIIPMITFHVGHMIIDVLEQLYWTMMKTYGRIRTDSLIVFDVAGLPERGILLEKIRSFVYDSDLDTFPKIFQLFTEVPIITMNELQFSMLNLRYPKKPTGLFRGFRSGGVLFKDLHIGLSASDGYFYLGYQLHPYIFSSDDSQSAGMQSSIDQLATRYQTFRSFLLTIKDLNATAKEEVDEIPDSAYVFFVQREKNRRIMNLPSMKQWVDQELSLIPKCSMQKLDNHEENCIGDTRSLDVDIGDLSFSDQRLVLRDTRILLSTAGTAVHNMMFMTPGSAVIILMQSLSWCPWSWMYANQAVLLHIHVYVYCSNQEVYADHYNVNADDMLEEDHDIISRLMRSSTKTQNNANSADPQPPYSRTFENKFHWTRHYWLSGPRVSKSNNVTVNEQDFAVLYNLAWEATKPWDAHRKAVMNQASSCGGVVNRSMADCEEELYMTKKSTTQTCVLTQATTEGASDPDHSIHCNSDTLNMNTLYRESSASTVAEGSDGVRVSTVKIVRSGELPASIANEVMDKEHIPQEGTDSRVDSRVEHTTKRSLSAALPLVELFVADVTSVAKTSKEIIDMTGSAIEDDGSAKIGWKVEIMGEVLVHPSGNTNVAAAPTAELFYAAHPHMSICVEYFYPEPADYKTPPNRDDGDDHAAPNGICSAIESFNYHSELVVHIFRQHLQFLHFWVQASEKGGKFEGSDAYLSLDLRLPNGGFYMASVSPLYPAQEVPDAPLPYPIQLRIKVPWGDPPPTQSLHDDEVRTQGQANATANTTIVNTTYIVFSPLIRNNQSQYHLQRITRQFCISQRLTFHYCTILSSLVSHQLYQLYLRKAFDLPAIQYLPTPVDPFVFLHIDKTAGTTLREFIDEASIKYSLDAAIPCHGKQQQHAVHCTTFHLHTSSILHADNATWRGNISVVAGHFSWGVWDELYMYNPGKSQHLAPKPQHHFQQRSDEGDPPSCLVIGRHPIARAISYYYQRCYDVSTCIGYQRRLRDLSPQELDTVMYSIRHSKPNEHGTHLVILDNGMSDAACRVMSREPGTKGLEIAMEHLSTTKLEIPPPLTNEEAHQAIDNVKHCVVGVMEEWKQTKEIIEFWYPWLDMSSTDSDRRRYQLYTNMETAADLSAEQLAVMENLNKCDLAMYDVMRGLHEKSYLLISSPAFTS